jgi:hypothetical protein
MITQLDRASFLEIACPPSGYQLKYCIGTSFSLDLMCVVQMALNSKGLSEDEEANELQLFESIKEFGGRAMIFCQACRIKDIPGDKFKNGKSVRSMVYRLVDRIVHVVPAATTESAFHPKLWVFCFESANKKQPNRLRIVVGSKNLTRSQYLDVMVCLEGSVEEGEGVTLRGAERIHTFLEKIHLKSTAGRSGKKILEWLKSDMRHVKVQLPAGIEEIEFLPKASSSEPYKFFQPKTWADAIIVSPFLGGGTIEALNELDSYTLITGPKDIKELAGLVRETEGSAKSGPNRKWFLFRGDADMQIHAKIYLAKRWIGECN